MADSIWMRLNDEGRMEIAYLDIGDDVGEQWANDGVQKLTLPEGVDIMDLADYVWDGSEWHYDGWQTNAIAEEKAAAESLAAQNTAWETVRDYSLQQCASIMPDEVLLECKAVVPEWKVGFAYTVGMVCTYNDEIYRVAQAHTSQADWLPPNTPALYTHVTIDSDTGIEEWTQPTGAHDAYALGDIVMHNGKKWQSTVDNNVWEPGVYGWVEID